MIRQRRFIQCDIFSSVATKGNGLAVVNDADDLSTAQMQSFAAWTNLAETTFILKPDDPNADYKLRIFNPVREMLFAGHPTRGSCAAWQRWGGQPKAKNTIVQQCGIGLVDVHLDDGRNAFVAPATKIETLPPDRLDGITKKLGITRDKVLGSARLENGPVWNAIELEDAEEVLNIDASLVKYSDFGPIGFWGSTKISPRLILPSEC